MCIRDSPYRVYDPNRAKYPMRRAGERGEGKWEQITWDEALDEIAQKFTQYAQEFGPDSVGIASGAGNYGFLDLMPRFQARIGASTVGTPLDFAPFYSLNPMVGMSLNFHGNEMTDLVNSKTLVIWGSNPAVSQIQGMHFIMEAREQGTKVISIDPVYTATTAKCDQWIPLAPGTDGIDVYKRQPLHRAGRERSGGQAHPREQLLLHRAPQIGRAHV